MTKKTKSVGTAPEVPMDNEAQKNAELTLRSSVNAAIVMATYQGNIVGKDVDISALIGGLRDSFAKSKDGDLSELEEMLIGQATALQSIFVSLARRAHGQEYQKNFQSFLSLALKAQAQSRATIQAVVEPKYPKQVAFVKQANISHGPQQVNNGPELAAGRSTRSNTRTRTHAEENQSNQSKLLEDHSHERTPLDTRTTTTAGRSNSALETMGAVHLAKKRTG